MLARSRRKIRRRTDTTRRGTNGNKTGRKGKWRKLHWMWKGKWSRSRRRKRNWLMRSTKRNSRISYRWGAKSSSRTRGVSGRWKTWEILREESRREKRSTNIGRKEQKMKKNEDPMLKQYLGTQVLLSGAGGEVNLAKHLSTSLISSCEMFPPTVRKVTTANTKTTYINSKVNAE